jgi:hypothetical protein
VDDAEVDPDAGAHDEGDGLGLELAPAARRRSLDAVMKAFVGGFMDHGREFDGRQEAVEDLDSAGFRCVERAAQIVDVDQLDTVAPNRRLD